jgi:hypothetical protein
MLAGLHIDRRAYDDRRRDDRRDDRRREHDRDDRRDGARRDDRERDRDRDRDSRIPAQDRSPAPPARIGASVWRGFWELSK